MPEKPLRVSQLANLPAHGLDPHARIVLTEILERHAQRINHTAFDVTSIAASTTVAHDVVLVSTGASTVTVSLVPALEWEDKIMHVKKIDAGVGPIVIDPNGSETVDGRASYTVSTQWTAVALISDGSNWFTV